MNPSPVVRLPVWLVVWILATSGGLVGLAVRQEARLTRIEVTLEMLKKDRASGGARRQPEAREERLGLATPPTVAP